MEERTGVVLPVHEWHRSFLMAAARLLRPIEILVDRLLDPARRERTAAAVLLAYAAAWTLYGVLSKASQDVHVDMSELVAWAREPALGYPKHPPLAAWLVRAWFSVFPASDWAYHLLAIATAALALWIACRLMARYLSPEKQVLGLALLTLIPFFNFHALKFNVNTVLLPLWAATAFWFLRSYETRRILYAALAGLGAAGSMLGKYWSVFLLAGLGAAALIDQRRVEYFRSWAPWVTIPVGAAVLAPHFAWLYAHDFESFSYALKGQAEPKSFSEVAIRTVGYLAGAAAYVTLPVLLAWINTRPSRAALRDTLLPREGDRQLVAAAFWAPLLLPAIAALIFRIELTSLWTMSAFALLPTVLLSSPLIRVERTGLVRVVAFAVLFPLVALALAPVIAWSTHRAGVAPTAHASLLVPRVAAEWRQATDKPLKIVGGSADLAYGVAFYLPDAPSAYPDFSRQLAPWIDPTQIARDGMAIVCLASDQGCLAAARQQGPAARQVEVEIVRAYFDIPGRPERYVIMVIPARG